jgi:hypothetical protein
VNGVKRPLDEIVPKKESTLQVTAVLLVPLTVAVNWMLCEPSKTTFGSCGETLTVIPPAVARRVTVADAVLAESSWLLALITTLLLASKLAGAVYRPFGSMKPTENCPPGKLLTLHETAVFTAPVTFALNCSVEPS